MLRVDLTAAYGSVQLHQVHDLVQELLHYQQKHSCNVNSSATVIRRY